MEIETKFNIGDEVWCFTHNKAKKGVIQKTGEGYSYVSVGLKNDPVFVKNYKIFKTKEELIESLFN